MPNFWQLATLSIHKMQHNTLRIFIFDWKVSNFVSLPWKLINPYYHSLDSLGMCPPSCKVWIDPLEKQDWTTFLWSAYLLPWTAGCWHHYATCIFIKRIWCIFFPLCVSFSQLSSMKNISITCFMVKRKISKLLHTQCMPNITCNNFVSIHLLLKVA